MSWALRTFTIAATVLVALAAYGWSTDKIVWQGELTVYTAHCTGAWQGKQCSGRLEAADRFRFRALRAHREVLFWIVASSEPSGKFTDCDIVDRRNWTCKPTADASRTIAAQVVHGRPTSDRPGGTMEFHSIDKWQWWLLRLGVPVTHEANE